MIKIPSEARKILLEITSPEILKAHDLDKEAYRRVRMSAEKYRRVPSYLAPCLRALIEYLANSENQDVANKAFLIARPLGFALWRGEERVN